MTRLTNAERETHLYWNLEDRCWKAWTEVPAHQRRLERMGWQRDGNEWTAPTHAVLIRKAVKVPRPSGNAARFAGKGKP